MDGQHWYRQKKRIGEDGVAEKVNCPMQDDLATLVFYDTQAVPQLFVRLPKAAAPVAGLSGRNSETLFESRKPKQAPHGGWHIMDALV